MADQWTADGWEMDARDKDLTGRIAQMSVVNLNGEPYLSWKAVMTALKAMAELRRLYRVEELESHCTKEVEEGEGMSTLTKEEKME